MQNGKTLLYDKWDKWKERDDNKPSLNDTYTKIDEWENFGELSINREEDECLEGI